MRGIACALALLVTLFAGAAHADDTRAEWQLGDRSDTPHVDVPFMLDLVVAGFDEAPQPDAPKLDIPDATVTFVAVQPNVQRGMQIINGKRSDFVRVTWVVRWRVEPHKAGRMRIPQVTIAQGAKKATAQAAETQVDTVQTTDAMKLALTLPDRPIFVGETVEVTLTWLFRGQPQDDPRWAIPLMQSDAFTVSGPPSTTKGKALTFPAGAKELQLPYTIDQVEQDGTKLNRLTAKFFIAPKKPGKIDVPASAVVVSLPVGRADFFGNAPSELFRAMDVPRTLEVKPLPQTDRPPSFAGAVGEQFSIEVRTSRSVVQLGEPFDLDVQVKSNQRLDTLALGKLDGPGGLPKEKFTVPADPPTGELSDDGKTKTFKITAQVTGPANEVPAIAFSYFDPTKGTYQTIHSEPIALSVKGGSVVGADEVIATKPKAGSGAAIESTDALVNVNADLALSSTGDTDSRPLGGSLVWVLVGLLYAIPLALLAARTWQLRTQSQREEAAEVRAARKKVEELLDRSGTAPAREIAGPLAAAFRDLARVSNRTLDDGGLLAKLETEAFAPATAAVPLSPDLRSDAAGLLRRWTTEARRARGTRKAAAATLLLLAVGGYAHAAAVDDGRVAYQDAMAQPADSPARKAAFRRAATAFAEAARTTPDRPELLTDWGNAALGAGDIAGATLAYRRALAIDPGNARARHNLAWLRSRQSDTFRPQGAGGADTLLFFHSWPRTRKLLVGAGAFAIAVLLLVPWSGRRRRGLMVGLALVPFAVWVAMLASVLLENRHGDDAIVMDDVVLRAADSNGAPAALPSPVPRGVEVTVLERRDSWTKVQLAGGIAGWLPSGAVERVTIAE